VAPVRLAALGHASGRRYPSGYGPRSR
jgi:hypothetical protein